jgi:[acyl-carrier-protein] S-malonyltransferase
VTRSSMLDQQVLAWACGEAVSAGDVEALLAERVPPAALGTAPELARRWALGVILVEAVIAANARTRACEGAAALRAAVCRDDLESRPVAHREASDYYRSNLHLYRRPEARRVRHKRAPCVEETTARALGDESGLVASDLGWVVRGELSGPLEEAIFASDLGCWVGPIAAASCRHWVRVDEIRPAHVVAFEHVEQEIHTVLVGARSAGAWAAWVERHLAQDVVLSPGTVSPFGPGAFGWAHRH